MSNEYHSDQAYEDSNKIPPPIGPALYDGLITPHRLDAESVHLPNAQVIILFPNVKSHTSGRIGPRRDWELCWVSCGTLKAFE